MISKIDQAGNIYFCGSFNNSFDFDPSNGVDVKVSVGNSDAYISKFDSYGNYLWTITYGSTTQDAAYNLDIDTLGNVYVTGFITGTTDFDPSASTNIKTSLGSFDTYIASFDFSGKLRWVNVIGNTGNDQGFSVKLDKNGDICATGAYQGLVDFDPSATTFNLSSQNLNDVFIAKYSSLGNLIWAKSLGGNSADRGLDIAIDNNNEILVTGDYFSSDFDLDPSPSNSTNIASKGDYDAFIAKYSSSGAYIWSKTISSPALDYPSTIGIDDLNNIYISASFTSSITFSGANIVLNTTTSDNGYLASFDSNGIDRWVKYIAGIKPYNCVHVNSKNLYISGQFTGTTDLDPNSGIDNFTSTGTTDAFISKYDTDGNYYWSKKLGGVGDENFKWISNKNELIFINGYFNNSFSQEGYSLTTAGLNDIMFLKMTDNSFISNNQIITVITPPVTITSPPITVTSLNIVTITVNKIILIDNNNNSITGTNNKLENQRISIYPNPSNGNFTIETTSMEAQKIQIYNSRSIKLFETFQKVIEMKNCSTGIYLVKLLDRYDKLIETHKIVIE